jgi:hypothetical protein
MENNSNILFKPSGFSFSFYPWLSLLAIPESVEASDFEEVQARGEEFISILNQAK